MVAIHTEHHCLVCAMHKRRPCAEETVPIHLRQVLELRSPPPFQGFGATSAGPKCTAAGGEVRQAATTLSRVQMVQWKRKSNASAASRVPAWCSSQRRHFSWISYIHTVPVPVYTWYTGMKDHSIVPVPGVTVPRCRYLYSYGYHHN